MKELWELARQYGLVRLTSLKTGNYYCVIAFNTIEHVELEAKSAIDCATPEIALQHALDNAIMIVNSIYEPLTKLKEITDGKSTST